MHTHNSATYHPRQVQRSVPVLHLRGIPRRTDQSSQNTTSRCSGNGKNLSPARNLVASPRVIHVQPSHDKPSPHKRLNPLAAEYVPTTYIAPAASDPGWVDFRNPSPSLSRGSTLNPIEEEPDLIFDDVTDVSFIEDRLPDRDDMTGGLMNSTNRVYKMKTLLSFRNHSACLSEPDMLAESVLTTTPCYSIVEAIIQAMNDPIVVQQKPKSTQIRETWRPRRPWPRKKVRRRLPKTRLAVPRTELDKLMRKTTSILNKIAPDKFERLSMRLFEFISSAVTCAEHLEAVLQAVVNTAVMQPAFVERYVQLLGVLADRQEIVDSWEWAHTAHVNSRKIIKGIVLDICRRLHELYWFESHPDYQQEFLFQFGWAYWDMEIEDDVLGKIASFSLTPDEEAAAKLKSKFLGIEIVIAEMCNQKLMSKGSLCQNVMNPLLRCQHKKSTSEFDDDEYVWRYQNCSAVELEAACKLLTVCGATLDHSPATRWVDRYVDVICDRAQDFDNRIKFMAMDLRDLRAANWNDRREESETEERIVLARRSAHARA